MRHLCWLWGHTFRLVEVREHLAYYQCRWCSRRRTGRAQAADRWSR